MNRLKYQKTTTKPISESFAKSHVLMWKRGVAASILLLASLLLFGFGCSEKPKAYNIGVVAPLTGPISTYGENIRDGALLAMEELNEKGGIDGTPIHLVFEDEGAGPQSAVSSVRKLIAIDRVPVIIGPATSNGVMAAAPIAEENHVVLLSPSGTSDNISQAGDYVFRNRASASQEAAVFAKYIIEDLGIRKYAVLRSDADYAENFVKVCNTVMQGQGGTLLLEEVFAEGSTDFRSQLAKIKATNPTGLFIIGVPVELAGILRQAKEMGLNCQFFSNTIDSPEIFKLAEGAEEGLTFVTTFYDPKHGNDRIREFDEAFRAKFGRASHLFGANAYDAVYLVKQVIESHGYTGESIKAGLYGINRFSGASGQIEFDENGDLEFTTVAIKKISNGQFEFIREVQK